MRNNLEIEDWALTVVGVSLLLCMAIIARVLAGLECRCYWRPAAVVTGNRTMTARARKGKGQNAAA